MQHSKQFDKVIPAFVAAQAATKRAVKDADNPHFKSKYADLESVWVACREALATNKLAVAQDLTLAAEGVSCATRLYHESGQFIDFAPLVIPPMKRDAHGIGSSGTYARRFALSAALGVVPSDTDDDGNNASGKETKGTKRTDAPAQSPPEPPKSAPGVSAHKDAVREATRELMACGDDTTLTAFLPSIKGLAIASAKTWPDVWHGIPDEPDSGFRGMLVKAGEQCGIVPAVTRWIEKIEASAK